MNSNIQLLKISELHSFPENPFHVEDDVGMDMLVESIKEYGVMSPIIVRPDGDGYEIVSGHRRAYACEKAGVEEVPAFLFEIDRDQAKIILVDSNLARDNLLPSEKAFAYKMKLEAIKAQGAQVEHRGKSIEYLARLSPDSRAQIQRYIRLTYLEKPILNLVDQGIIAFTPAVELSYLSTMEQQILMDAMELNDATPTYSQSNRMKKLSMSGMLDIDTIHEIMSEIKGNQREVVKVHTDRIQRYFRPGTSYQEMEDTIVKALDQWYRKRERQMER